MVFEQQIWAQFAGLGQRIDLLRERRGLFVTSLIVALVIFVLAMIYVRPALPFFPSNLVGVTEQYYEIAADPFGYEWTNSPRGYRIALPMASYLIGLRGENLAYTTLFILFLFVFTLVYRTYRDTGSALEALALSTAFAFSCAFLLNLYDIASNEGVRVFLAVLMVFWAQRRILFWLVFAFSLYTHEGTALYLPFFLLLRWPHRKNFWDFFLLDVLPAVAIIGIYIPAFQSTGNAQYLSPWGEGLQSFLHATRINLTKWAWNAYDGTFSGLKLFWLPVLLAIGLALRDRRFYDVLLLLAPIGAFVAMMVISWEITRFALLASPALLVAYNQLRRIYGGEMMARTFLLLGVINLFVPQQISLGGVPGPMPSLPNMILFWLF